jgi:tRNA pseudouridine55 synthase
MFGILNVNKPAGWTSRDVVNRIAKLLIQRTAEEETFGRAEGRRHKPVNVRRGQNKPAKAGHAGTLDPLATGVLLVCIGPATRLVPLLHEHSKTYEATFLLGRSSPTDDVEGELAEVPVPGALSPETLERLLPEFTGRIEQVPPAYSAVKIKGERAYRAARQGKTVEVPSRMVTVHRIELTGFDGDASPPSFSLSITCGTGTYIRSIGRDLARRLGTEAVMSRLVRTSIGPFTLDASTELDQLKHPDDIADALQSPLRALADLPRFQADDEQIRRLRHGQTLAIPSTIRETLRSGRPVAVVDAEGNLIALAEEKRDRLAPSMVLDAGLDAGGVAPR